MNNIYDIFHNDTSTWIYIKKKDWIYYNIAYPLDSQWAIQHMNEWVRIACCMNTHLSMCWVFFPGNFFCHSISEIHFHILHLTFNILSFINQFQRNSTSDWRWEVLSRDKRPVVEYLKLFHSSCHFLARLLNAASLQRESTEVRKWK